MTRSFQAALLSLVGIFVVCVIVIVVNGRPVADMTYTPSTDSTSSPSSTTQPATPTDPYTMTDVAAHATSTNCWSAVNGSVYDLTSWVSRHPGGANAIKAMCGSDASSSFNAQHGKFPAAQSALILLKIGTLAS